MARIVVLIDLPPSQRYHQATLAALAHAGARLGVTPVVEVQPSDLLDPSSLGDGV